MRTAISLIALSTLTALPMLTLADNNYHLTNDTSYLDGDIDSRQHIYYPGDTIDVRVTLNGDISLLASQSVDIYLSVLTPDGSPTFRKINNYESLSSQRLYFIENISNSVVTPGTYQMALIATKPGGDPSRIGDWYNGFAGLMEQEALMYSPTTITGDSDGDGYWDSDFDRDGFYGDDDQVYEYYFGSNGNFYRSSEYRDWSDDDWGDDDDDDWDDDHSENDWDD
jgi:hypothetical protein